MTPARPVPYTAVAISLHWLIALLIFGGFGLGWYMHELPLSPQKLKLYSWHKWIGVTVFGLVLLRAAWRTRHPPPPLPASVPLWQRRASAASHALLYGLMIVIPLSGWLYSSASGFPTVYLGIPALTLPDLVEKDKLLAASLKTVHLWLNYLLAALVSLHVAAALKHQFVDRDGLLRRLWF